MVAEEPLRIEVRINEHMSIEDYVVWNIAGTVSTLMTKPEEKDITLMVYEIHKEILTGKGATPEQLLESDRLLEKFRAQYNV